MQELDMVLRQKPGKTEDCMLVEKEPGKLEQQAGYMLVGKGDCKQVGKGDCKQVEKEDCKQVEKEDCKL
jgi:hypothetical protein